MSPCCQTVIIFLPSWFSIDMLAALIIAAAAPFTATSVNEVLSFLSIRRIFGHPDLDFSLRDVRVMFHQLPSWRISWTSS